MMLAGAQEILKKARRRAPPPGPESYRSLFIVGLLFPLHILLGLAAVPLVLVALFVWRSPWAWALAACYAPLYAQPAHRGSSAVPGWQSTRFARALWRWYDASTHCADYFARFEARLSRWTAARGDGAKQYVVAIHPHGLAIFSRTFWLTERVAFLARPWRMIGATALFYIPIVREFTLLFGAVGADRATFEAMLGTGANVVVYPGGLDEANDDTASSAIAIRTRKGFVRLAVKHGVDVLPMFCFGELEAVGAVRPLPRGLSDFLRRKLRVSTTLFVGRFGLFVPRRVPFDLCVGAPISVAKRAPGTPEYDAEVQRVYEAYIAEIAQTFEMHKVACGYANRKLVFSGSG